MSQEKDQLQIKLSEGTEAGKNVFHMDYIPTIGTIFSGNWTLFYFNMYKEEGIRVVPYTDKEWDSYINKYGKEK